MYSTEAAEKSKPDKNSGLNEIRTHDLCDTDAAFLSTELSSQLGAGQLWVRNISVDGEDMGWIYETYIFVLRNKHFRQMKDHRSNVHKKRRWSDQEHCCAIPWKLPCIRNEARPSYFKFKFIWLRHSESTPSRRWNRTCVPIDINSFYYPPGPQKVNHNTGNYVPYSFREVCGFLKSPANHVTLKMRDTGLQYCLYSPYLRRLERLTICRCNYKGSTFSSVILRPWVLVRSGARTLDLPHGRLALYQLS